MEAYQPATSTNTLTKWGPLTSLSQWNPSEELEKAQPPLYMFIKKLQTLTASQTESTFITSRPIKREDLSQLIAKNVGDDILDISDKIQPKCAHKISKTIVKLFEGLLGVDDLMHDLNIIKIKENMNDTKRYECRVDRDVLVFDTPLVLAVLAASFEDFGVSVHQVFQALISVYYILNVCNKQDDFRKGQESHSGSVDAQILVFDKYSKYIAKNKFEAFRDVFDVIGNQLNLEMKFINFDKQNTELYKSQSESNTKQIVYVRRVLSSPSDYSEIKTEESLPSDTDLYDLIKPLPKSQLRQSVPIIPKSTNSSNKDAFANQETKQQSQISKYKAQQINKNADVLSLINKHPFIYSQKPSYSGSNGNKVASEHLKRRYASKPRESDSGEANRQLINNLTEQNAQLKESNKGKDIKIKLLKEKFKDKNNEIKQLKESNKEKDNGLRYYENKIKNQSSEIKNLKEKNEEQNVELKHFDVKIKDCNNGIRRLQGHIFDQETEIKHLKGKNDKQETKIKELEEKNHELNDRTQQLKEEHEKKIQKIESDKDEFKSFNALLKINNDKINAKNQSLKAEIVEKEKSLKDEIDRLKNINQLLNDKLASNEQIIDQSRKDNIAKDVMIGEYKISEAINLAKISELENRIEATEKLGEGKNVVPKNTLKPADTKGATKEFGKDFNPENKDA